MMPKETLLERPEIVHPGQLTYFVSSSKIEILLFDELRPCDLCLIVDKIANNAYLILYAGKKIIAEDWELFVVDK